jgi:hypothetical protein
MSELGSDNEKIDFLSTEIRAFKNGIFVIQLQVALPL